MPTYIGEGTSGKVADDIFEAAPAVVIDEPEVLRDFWSEISDI
jgi:hypothetical protein